MAVFWTGRQVSLICFTGTQPLRTWNRISIQSRTLLANRRQAAFEANAIGRFCSWLSDADYDGPNWLEPEGNISQVREAPCMITDLVGKHIRTAPVRVWVKRAGDKWTTAAGLNHGASFRRVSRVDKICGDRSRARQSGKWCNQPPNVPLRRIWLLTTHVASVLGSPLAERRA